MAEANPPHPFIKVERERIQLKFSPDEVGSEDMCEHGKNPRTMVIVTARHLIDAFNKGAEFRRTE
jgi:hypothetical protein